MLHSSYGLHAHPSTVGIEVGVGGVEIGLGGVGVVVEVGVGGVDVEVGIMVEVGVGVSRSALEVSTSRSVSW